MAHHTLKSGYSNLIDRLNKFPQGAPKSEYLYKILSVLFSEKEAELVARIPIRPFKADRAAKIWQMPLPEAQKILDDDHFGLEKPKDRILEYLAVQALTKKLKV